MSHGVFIKQRFKSNLYIKRSPAATDHRSLNGKTYFESVPSKRFLFFMQDLFRFDVILPVNDVVNIFRSGYALFISARVCRDSLLDAAFIVQIPALPHAAFRLLLMLAAG
jgi:hypothetical protein